jgi:hypothetical protein
MEAGGAVRWIACVTLAGLVSGASGAPRAGEEIVPRRVLVLYDGDEESDLVATTAHRLLALPLEYLGFAVDYADVRSALPSGKLARRYAGVVTWFTDDELGAPAAYQRFLVRVLDERVRLAMVGHLGAPLDRGTRARLGLQVSDTLAPPFRLAHRDGLVGLEAPPPPSGRTAAAVYASGPGTIRHVEVIDARGAKASPVVTAPWGGLALDPFVVEEGFKKRMRWVLDPFTFLSRALALAPMPVVDVTTENGSRVLTVHIDGDGFVSRAEIPGTPWAGEVIRRELLEAFPAPTTVSVVEGEIGPTGLHPAKSPEVEAVAREIFRLPHVAAASHTFSHPFDWQRAAGAPRVIDPDDDEVDDDPEHLPIPGYRYDVRREVVGSVRYIDRRLLPEGKRTTVFLWSGSAYPDEKALALAEGMGLSHLNGFNADAPVDRPGLSMVPSLGRPLGSHFQPYAAAHNEVAFTNNWHGPFYGYRRVIESFQFTDQPRRLKPISIYYHFYSGSKAASVEALREVYRWAMAQEVRPIHLAAYIRKVHDFQRATLAKRPDGSWRVDGVASVRTLRLPAALGWPDLDRSEGVVGVADLPQGRYVALDGRSSVNLHLGIGPPRGPYLVRSNAGVSAWRRQGSGAAARATIKLVAQPGPVTAVFGGCPQGVTVTAGGRTDRVEPGKTWRFDGRDTGEVTLVCQ